MTIEKTKYDYDGNQCFTAKTTRANYYRLKRKMLNRGFFVSWSLCYGDVAEVSFYKYIG